MLFKDLCLSHFAIFCQQTCELWKCRWPFLLPSREIAIQRLDKLNPSLNIIIFKLREALETRSKSKMSHPPIHHLHSRETQGRLHRIRPLRRQTKLDPLELHLIIILLQYCNLCVGINIIHHHFFVTTSLFETLSMLYIFAIAFSLGCESPPSLLEKTFAWFETNRNPSSERKIKRMPLLIF